MAPSPLQVYNVDHPNFSVIISRRDKIAGRHTFIVKIRRTIVVSFPFLLHLFISFNIVLQSLEEILTIDFTYLERSFYLFTLLLRNRLWLW